MDFTEVEQARAFLRQHLGISRLVHAQWLSQASGAEVYLKLENETETGSFKPRGALYALHRHCQRGPVAGVVACSTGNHGAGVAFAARRCGVAATIFLPRNPNPTKRARIEQLGANIIEVAHDYEAAREHAASFAREHGWYFLEDGRDPDLRVGQATIGCEILEQLPAVEVLYVPVGDTTLITGVAFAVKQLKPEVRVIGVQAERAPAYYLSWQQRRVVSTDTCDTIADGLATRQPREENVRLLGELVDEMRLVSEQEMLQAIGWLLLQEHTVAEPAGAGAAAALLQAGQRHTGQKVVVLITGANITREILRQAVAKI